MADNKFKLPGKQNDNLRKFGLSSEIDVEHTEKEWFKVLNARYDELKKPIVSKIMADKNNSNLDKLLLATVEHPVDGKVTDNTELTAQGDIGNTLFNAVKEQAATLQKSEQQIQQKKSSQQSQPSANQNNPEEERYLSNDKKQVKKQIEKLKSKASKWRSKAIEDQEARKEDPFNFSDSKIGKLGKKVGLRFGKPNKGNYCRDPLLWALIAILLAQPFEHKRHPQAAEQYKAIKDKIAELEDVLDKMDNLQEQKFTDLNSSNEGRDFGAEMRGLEAEGDLIAYELTDELDDFRSQHPRVWQEMLENSDIQIQIGESVSDEEEQALSISSRTVPVA